ncbi:unnamed protein product [Agarophyton chilense]
MGRVGTAIADGVSRRALPTHLTLVDIDAARAEAEALDLTDALTMLRPLVINHSSDVASTAGSHLIFITAGARQRPGESRLQLLGRNVAILASIVPQAARLSPAAVLVVVSNPCDVLTYVTARLAGDATRVIGSGTNLDSARLVSLLARRARVAAREVQAVIVGEHGDSSVAAWSIATIAGLPLRAISADLEAPAVREDLLRTVRGAAAEIIRYKGFTATAVGESCADLARCVLGASTTVRPVTTRVPAATFDGLDQDVYLSLPVRLGAGHIGALLVPQLDSDEMKLLLRSAHVLLQAQRDADVHLSKVLTTE